MKELSGKKIWIIGASSGIGKALAVELASQGAELILSARNEEKLKDVELDLKGDHSILPLDVKNIDELSSAANSIGQLDSVIFMAAIYSAPSTERIDIKTIQQTIEINIGGAYNTVEAILPVFEKQAYGQIVLCGSVAGYRGLPYGQPYCSTKAAMINYAESLKIELEDKNIDFKLISPGFVKTPLTDKNEFDMPMIIEPDQAARSIVKGLTSRKFEIHFPKGFTYIMKFIDILPRWIYFPLARRMKKI